MYLLVFVTLVVSLIGIYAQALTLQAARLAKGQSAIVQEMITYQSIALDVARYAIGTVGPYAPGTAGCNLDWHGALPSLANCRTNPNGVSINGVCPQDYCTMPPLGMSFCSNPPTLPCWTNLPAGYGLTNWVTYNFLSIFYRPGPNLNYVITYVPPPTPTTSNPAPGFVMLGNIQFGARQIGLTMSDLWQQIKNSGLPPYSYGIVNGATNQLVTPPISNGATSSPMQYPLPAGGAYFIPDGSIGIISSF